MNIEPFKLHKEVIEKELMGRYISPKKVNHLLLDFSSILSIKTEGFSVQNRPIQSVSFGSGKIKIFMWSQMHGNESTTTKSLFDFLNYVTSKKHQKVVSDMLTQCTFCIIPMLNPDGAKKWTRVNANQVDLNRDAQALSQPESVILRKIFDSFAPDYCFNLHGQRSIYGFEESGKPSVLSFLAPAADEGRGFTFSRKRAAGIIAHIYKTLDPHIPGQIGLYDDSFNGDCVGDTFQSLGAATVLFEAGHYPNDYEREVTRAFIFKALLAAIDGICKNIAYPIEAYQAIPLHSKCFCDLHKIKTNGIARYHYEEVLKNGKIDFIQKPLPEDFGSGLFAHLSEIVT